VESLDQIAILPWLLEEWNRIPGVKPARLERIGGTLKAQIERRLREKKSKLYWAETFAIVSRSPWLTGRTKEGWRADIEWITGPKNLSKVRGGKYLDEPADVPVGSPPSRGEEQARRLLTKLNHEGEHDEHRQPKILNP
jgi:hypothetical protein